jgi:glycerol-3-phosphate acyltransferase PlsY
MTTAHRIVFALIPAGYLIGSVPFGLIVGLCQGIDVRKAGSGNIGATNVGRLLGRRFFLLTFLLDMLKGLIPMLGAGAALHWSVRLPNEPSSDGRVDYLLWLGVGFATILGHMFSIFLGLRGGKGVATSTGVVAGVFPYFTLPVLVAAVVWGITLKVTRIMSLASLLATVTLPLAYIGIGLAAGWPVFGDQLPLLIFCLLIAALIIYKHRANIARLRAGTELRIPRATARPHSHGEGAGGNGNGNGANGHRNGDEDDRAGPSDSRRLSNP